MNTKSIVFKLLLLIVIIMTATIVTICYFSITTVRTEIIDSTKEKLLSDLAMCEAYIDSQHPGEWSIKGGSLFKGEQIMNNNNELVDILGELTGDTVTIFQDAIRVTTNVVDSAGTRAIGTEVSAVVKEAVLEEGQYYLGQANVVGRVNQTAYKPIKDSFGEIIGILYVGVPIEPYEAIVDNIRNRFIIVSLIGILLPVGFLFIFIRRMLKPLTRLVAAANSVASGDLTIPPIETKAKDEIGIMSVAINRMMANLRNLIAQTSNITGQLASSSQDVSETIEETAKNTYLIIDSVQQINKMIKETLEIADRLREEIDTDSKTASNTMLEMESLLTSTSELIRTISSSTQEHLISMEEISDAAESLTELLTNLSHQLEMLTNRFRI